MTAEDIGEGEAGSVAELGVARQPLEERLSERLPGMSPQPLRGHVLGNHLAVHVLGGLPRYQETIIFTF